MKKLELKLSKPRNPWVAAAHARPAGAHANARRPTAKAGRQQALRQLRDELRRADAQPRSP